MDILKYFFTGEAIAAYIVGAAVIVFGLRQLRYNSTLNKKSKVFEDTSSDIKEAVKLVNSIETATNSLIDEFGSEANRTAEANNKKMSDEEVDAEIQRRLQAIDTLYQAKMKHNETVFGSTEAILNIIAKIEQSTLLKPATKRAARQLYYITTKQHEYVNLTLEVLGTLEVVPPIGTSPNVSPDTFNAISDLCKRIANESGRIRNFLRDLEVIVHNDLVKGIYGEAAYSSLHDEVLTPDGIIEKRINNPLL